MKKNNPYLPNHSAATKTTDFIFGIHPILEALDAGKELDKILLQQNFITHALLRSIHERALEAGIPVSKVPTERLNRVTRKNHQGVIAFLASVGFASLDHVISEAFGAGRAPLILLLDGITDVRNFGAIVRTAECTGVDAVVVGGKSAARIGEDAVKTSAGALHLVPIVRSPQLQKTAEFLQHSGLQLIACTEKTKTTLFEQALDLALPTVIVMGSEEKGIDPSILKIADGQARIPLLGKIESLNVSVAAGVLLYEAVRQRKKAHSK
ncbi:MAG: 23S rRNA (guanosine(2251)-2'-O)-methyltransferase RlmB [Bernardetiaceae bacterium]